MANLLPYIGNLPRDQPPLARDLLYFDTPSTSGALSAAEFSAQAERCPLAAIAIVKRRLFNHCARELAYQAALEVVLAAEWYRRVHGELPQDLSQLVTAGMLPEVPDDPWSPVPAPLRYERDPSDVSRAKVWSIGKNGVDDGGRLAPGDYDVGDVGLWIGGEPDSK